MQITSLLSLAALVASPVLGSALDKRQFSNGTNSVSSSASRVSGSASILPIGTGRTNSSSSSTRPTTTTTSTRTTTTTGTATNRATVTVIQPVSVIIVPIVVSTTSRTTVVGGATTVVVSPVYTTSTSTVRVTAQATTCPAVVSTRTVTATVCPVTSSARPATTSSTRPATTSSTRPATTSSSRPATTSSTRPATTSSTRPATTSSTRPAATSSSVRPTTTTAVATAANGPANCPFPSRAAAATLFPNLIVPVQRANPSTSYGTQYIGVVRSGQDLLIQFDVPTTRTYTLELALPIKSQLTTSDYTLTGDARFAVARLPQTIRSSTNYAQISPNPDTLAYTTFTALQGQQNLQIVLPNQQGTAGTTATYIVRSVSGASLTAFFDYNCPVVGIVLV